MKRDKLMGGTANAVKAMGNAPLTAFQEAENRFYEIYGSAKVESSRWFVATMACLVALIAMSIAMYSVFPLKTVVPYMVTVDRQNGAAAQPVAAQAFKPDATVRTYFLTQWVEKLLTLDPYQTEKNIKVAYSLTRDKASREFTEFMQADKPIERLVKDRTLTRVPIINSINPGSDDGIAFVRVTTEERSGAGAPTAKSFMLTIHYVLVPPTSEAELRVNPLGMFITHFVKSDELGS